jgi:hypothetical protein
MTWGSQNVIANQLHDESERHPDMATELQREIGIETSLVPTDRRRIRSAIVVAPGAQPLVLASPPNHAPQHHAEELGFLESARMDREMAREIPRSSQQRSRKSGMSIIAALTNMSNRRFLVLVAGVALLVGGLLALRFPVFLPDFDQWGFQINCGSGFKTSLTQAGIADSTGAHFVDQCHTAIAIRRVWAIPVTVAGALLLSALLVVPPSTRPAADLAVPADGADGAEAFDGAITPASDAPFARTPPAQNLIQGSPAAAA